MTPRAMIPVLCLLAGCAQAQVQHLSAGAGKPIWSGATVREGVPGERLSVARFTLAPGRSDPPSHMRHDEEWFLVEQGHGTVWLDGRASPIGPGDLVRVAAPVVRRIAAAPDSPLVFAAITCPAFSPQDYVPDGPVPRE